MSKVPSLDKVEAEMHTVQDAWKRGAGIQRTASPTEGDDTIGWLPEGFNPSGVDMVTASIHDTSFTAWSRHGNVLIKVGRLCFRMVPIEEY